MVQFTVFTLALAAVSINAAPLTKRIAQTIADSTAKWEAACTAAGGSTQCNPVSVTAFTTLLAAAGPCEQQNAADSMIDLAKTLNNDPTMIKFAQIFAQQARNSPTSLSIPYCQTAPRNAELNGLYQCQWQGDNPTTFVGGTAVGGAGTIPFGMSSALTPAGSCPANPSGPIPNGSQLTDITSDPGVGSTTSGNSTAPPTSTGSPTPTMTPSATESGAVPTSTDTAGDDSDCTDDANEPSTTPAAMPSATPSATTGFALANGQAAQKLNAQFVTLTTTSTCTEGTNACLNGDFAQCVGGKFVTQSCGPSLTCAALPLVNSAGTSITCTTNTDALRRIAATGVQGGLTGSG